MNKGVRHDKDMGRLWWDGNDRNGHNVTDDNDNNDDGHDKYERDSDNSCLLRYILKWKNYGWNMTSFSPFTWGGEVRVGTAGIIMIPPTTTTTTTTTTPPTTVEHNRWVCGDGCGGGGWGYHNNTCSTYPYLPPSK